MFIGALPSVFLAFFVYTAQGAVSAPTPLLFGPEFTFAPAPDKKLLEEIKALYDHILNHLVHGQPSGAEFSGLQPSLYEYEFKSPNGWQFNFTNDVGVVEFRMRPMTVAGYKKFASDIQDAIFASTALRGMFPMQYLGGGHINIGAAFFENAPLLAYNFVVDFYNHNELGLGALGFDTNNAQPLAYAESDVQQEVKEFLNLARQRIEAGEPFESSYLFSVLSGMVKKSYEVNREWRMTLHHGHHDISYSSAHQNDGSARIEIRCVRPQQDIYTWIHQIELLEGRINYLRTISKPIPFQPRVSVERPLRLNFDPEHGHLLNPPVDPQEALKSFYEYVTESGQPWEDHRSYIWPKWIERGDLQRFEASQFYRERLRVDASSGRCAKVLGE